MIGIFGLLGFCASPPECSHLPNLTFKLNLTLRVESLTGCGAKPRGGNIFIILASVELTMLRRISRYCGPELV